MKTKQSFSEWRVDGGRLITNGRVRFYLAGCRDEGTQSYRYEPVWLDKLACDVCAMLNGTRDTGESL